MRNKYGNSTSVTYSKMEKFSLQATRRVVKGGSEEGEGKI